MSVVTQPEFPIVVFVGMCGSGKSVLTKHLADRGWPVVHFGHITMLALKEKGLPVNEANERREREELRRLHGPAVYAKLSLPAIREALKAGHVVIDGLYSWSEYRLLRAEFGPTMRVVAVCTPRRMRYARLAARTVRPLSPADAEARDVAEIENLEKGGPIAFADYMIVNDSTAEDARRRLDEIVADIEAEARSSTAGAE